MQKATNDAGEKVWQIEYQGLYAIFYARVDLPNSQKNEYKKNKKNKKKEPEKFLIHKGFNYETKID